MIVFTYLDLQTSTVVDAFRSAKYKGEILATNAIEEAEVAIRSGKKVATTDYKLAVQLSSVDVVIDATGSPELGARISLLCFDHKKHIVMMNVECDVTVGPILRKMAENAGVVYSLTAGDEPGSLFEVYRFANALGYS